MDWCLSRSPKPGRTDEDDTKDICIIHQLRSGEASGAQILVVRDTSSEGHFVAKIFDPLYYSFIVGDSWTPYRVHDVVARADADYAAEAAAYIELDSTPFPGTFVPRFYGTWTTNIDTHVNGIKHVREVRIVLMEYVQGICMRDVDATKLTEDEKDNIMIKLVEGESELSFAGIEHNDISPRNVILGPPGGVHAGSTCTSLPMSSSGKYIDFVSPEIRVCLFDFNLSTVDRLKPSIDPSIAQQRFSPVIRWWANIHEFCEVGWVPSSDRAHEWLWVHWEHSDGKYVDAERDPDNPLFYPMPVGTRASIEAEKAAKAS